MACERDASSLISSDNSQIRNLMNEISAEMRHEQDVGGSETIVSWRKILI